MIQRSPNPIPSGMRPLLLLGCLATAAVAGPPVRDAIPLTLEQITSRIERSDQQRQEDLDGYTVTRKYVLHNSHMKTEATMLVRVTYRNAGGKTFQVLEEKGTEGMGKRVFQHLIQAESEGSRADNQQRGRLNSRNYEFALVGTAVENGRRCFILELHPRTKTKYLFNGKAWVDAEDFAVVKLEGRPAANVSFWVGKPMISQTWEKVGDFWMAACNRSHAESRILGASDLVVENAGYRLNSVTIAKVALRRGATSVLSTIN